MTDVLIIASGPIIALLIAAPLFFWAWRGERCKRRDWIATLQEVHEYQCGCDHPGSAFTCVAKPEGTFAALAREQRNP